MRIMLELNSQCIFKTSRECSFWKNHFYQINIWQTQPILKLQLNSLLTSLSEQNLSNLGQSEGSKCYRWPMRICYNCSSLLSKMLLMSLRPGIWLLYLLGLNSALCLGLHQEREDKRNEKCELKTSKSALVIKI